MLADSQNGNGQGMQNANAWKQNNPPPPDRRHFLENNSNGFMSQELPAPHPSLMFDPDQVHQRMIYVANNQSNVQSRVPNGSQMNQGSVNPSGQGHLYPTIPAELQGSGMATTVLQGGNGV